LSLRKCLLTHKHAMLLLLDWLSQDVGFSQACMAKSLLKENDEQLCVNHPRTGNALYCNNISERHNDHIRDERPTTELTDM